MRFRALALLVAAAVLISLRLSPRGRCGDQPARGHPRILVLVENAATFA